MGGGVHRVAVRVLRDEGGWVAVSDYGAVSCLYADTLPRLLAEVELFKRHCTEVPDGATVCVDYVADEPDIAGELSVVHKAYLELPPQLRPVAVSWDIENDRSADPAHTGTHTNPEQLRRLEQLQAGFRLAGQRRF